MQLTHRLGPQVFDVSTVTPNYRELQEVSLFLAQPGTLDPSLALGLYISIGGAEWQYRGYVSNTQPSEVMPLQWPEQDQPLTGAPGTIQLGVSLEPQGAHGYCMCILTMHAYLFSGLGVNACASKCTSHS